MLAGYGAAAALSTVAAFFLLQLSHADLRVPFDYGGDALQYQLIIKTVLEHGWWWSNPSVGAPGALDFRDFPVAAHDTLHLLVIKLLSLFGGDWALLTNVYFLLGFPLITCSAMMVFRHFRVAYGPALVASVLYSFLPSRLLKGEGHLFLDVFYEVPLSILVLLWVCSEEPPLVGHGVAEGREGWRWPGLSVRSRRSIAALAVCALTASTSLYYSFFTICLLVVGGGWASLERRSVRNAVAGVALAGAIVVALGLQGLPTIVYHLRHGPNPAVAQRNSGEAEVYGMKIVQLLLPVDGHRLAAMRELKRQYNAYAPIIGENGTTSLGVVGGVGFLVLLGVVFLGRRPDRPDHELLRRLAALNLIAVLLGTVGGFGALIALLVSPQIRTYSRINVFIGFFALFAVALVLDRLARRRPRLGAHALAVVLGVGLLDQATPAAVRPYARMKRVFASDAEFVRRIEARVAPGSAVFELPYVPFPESAYVHHVSSYDLVRPYLHSSALRWSFPTMRGRAGDDFARRTAELEPGRMLPNLASLGFGGVLVDRDGFEDGGVALEAAFREVLGAKPLLDDGARFAFFDLTDFRRGRTVTSPAEIEALMHPLGLTFADGCYDAEVEPRGTFHWCGPTGEVVVDNDTALVRRVSIRMTLVAARPPARLVIEGDLMSGAEDLVGLVPLAREVDVPPGRHVVRFRCDGPRVEAPRDPRTMVWRIENLSLEERAPGEEGKVSPEVRPPGAPD